MYSKLRPYLNKVIVADTDGYSTSEILPITFFGNILSEYAQLYLMSPSFIDYTIKCSYGVKMPRLGTADGKNAFFALPPLFEQEKIVEQITKILSYIESYNIAYDKIEKLNTDFPDKLKKSILQWAVQGKLVSQDENDEPASVLLERIREEKAQLIRDKKIKKDKQESVIFKRDNSHYEKAGNIERCIDDEIPFEIPNSWHWERLINVFNFIDYRGKTPTKLTAGVPLITAKNIKRGFIDYHIQDFISEKEYLTRQTRGVSRKGDILFTTEAPLGNIAIADLLEYSAGQRLITLQQYTSENKFYNELFMHFMLSDEFQKMLISESTGTTVKGIKADKLKRTIIPIPPLAEQQRILEKIEQIFRLKEKL